MLNNKGCFNIFKNPIRDKCRSKKSFMDTTTQDQLAIKYHINPTCEDELARELAPYVVFVDNSAVVCSRHPNSIQEIPIDVVSVQQKTTQTRPFVKLLQALKNNHIYKELYKDVNITRLSVYDDGKEDTLCVLPPVETLSPEEVFNGDPEREKKYIINDMINPYLDNELEGNLSIVEFMILCIYHGTLGKNEGELLKLLQTMYFVCSMTNGPLPTERIIDISGNQGSGKSTILSLVKCLMPGSWYSTTAKKNAYTFDKTVAKPWILANEVNYSKLNIEELKTSVTDEMVLTLQQKFGDAFSLVCQYTFIFTRDNRSGDFNGRNMAYDEESKERRIYTFNTKIDKKQQCPLFSKFIKNNNFVQLFVSGIKYKFSQIHFMDSKLKLGVGDKLDDIIPVTSNTGFDAQTETQNKKMQSRQTNEYKKTEAEIIEIILEIIGDDKIDFMPRKLDTIQQIFTELPILTDATSSTKIHNEAIWEREVFCNNDGFTIKDEEGKTLKYIPGDSLSVKKVFVEFTTLRKNKFSAYKLKCNSSDQDNKVLKKLTDFPGEFIENQFRFVMMNVFFSMQLFIDLFGLKFNESGSVINQWKTPADLEYDGWFVPNLIPRENITIFMMGWLIEKRLKTGCTKLSAEQLRNMKNNIASSSMELLGISFDNKDNIKIRIDFPVQISVKNTLIKYADNSVSCFTKQKPLQAKEKTQLSVRKFEFRPFTSALRVFGISSDYHDRVYEIIPRLHKNIYEHNPNFGEFNHDTEMFDRVEDVQENNSIKYFKMNDTGMLNGILNKDFMKFITSKNQEIYTVWEKIKYTLYGVFIKSIVQNKKKIEQYKYVLQHSLFKEDKKRTVISENELTEMSKMLMKECGMSFEDIIEDQKSICAETQINPSCFSGKHKTGLEDYNQHLKQIRIDNREDLQTPPSEPEDQPFWEKEIDIHGIDDPFSSELSPEVCEWKMDEYIATPPPYITPPDTPPDSPEETQEIASSGAPERRTRTGSPPPKRRKTSSQ